MTSRPPEIEQWSNSALIHPLSRRAAAALINAGVSANTVSLLGMSCLASAAILFAYGSWPTATIAGITLLFVSHVLDGADGIIARETGTASRAGEVIDGICDYLGYGFLYLALYINIKFQLNGYISLIVTFITIISHIIQANFYESRRRQYCFRAYGTPWIGSGHAGDYNENQSSKKSWIISHPAVIFLKFSQLVSYEPKELVYFDGNLNSRQAEEKYRVTASEHIKKYFILSQNTKSLIYGIAMLTQCAMFYSIFVIFFLNLALIFIRIYEKIKWKNTISKIKNK